jgi:pyruvate dehydrogenase complex dehydrogenase (E1) component
MSCWTKEELENMLEDVVNELDLSDGMIEHHGQFGTAPAELVRLVLEQKDSEIAALNRGMKALHI